MTQYIGFDIGGTKCAVCAAEADLVQNECSIIDRIQIATGHRTWRETLDSLTGAALSLVKKHRLQPAAAGISCGGPLNGRTGVILSPPNLPGWDNVPAADYLSTNLGIPVRLQNDANACTVAEWKFGAGKGCRNLIFLTFGTGLGAGLILDGHLYEGTNGLAGEAGHIRLADKGPEGYGKAGSFEGFCSGGGIARLGRILVQEARISGKKSELLALPDEDITAKSISTAAENGDALAQEVYRISAEYLGKGIAILIDLLNPEKIIIGSVFTRSEKLFRDSMDAMVKKEALAPAAAVCTVVPSALGDSIGDYAAVAAGAAV